MERTITARPSVRGIAFPRGDRIRQARWLLHVGYVAAPTIAGLDKFFGVLTDWDKYLAPAFARVFGGHSFMLFVGAVEILAGLIVAVKPRIGAYVVAGWLLAIIVNLVAHGGYLDIALRDFGLMLGALALGRLVSGEKAQSSVPV